MHRLQTVIAAGGLLALLGLSWFPSEAQTPESTKRALLIGINQYKSGALQELAGCINDVELMADILVGKFEFEPENIQILRNSDATRAAILAAIRSHLIEPSAAGDIALMHFSGHGSRMIDNSGDELDGFDETLVPYDSRTPGIFDISDDEINGLMKRLSAKTPHVVFIFDSCHSGSASRAAEVGNRVRQVAPDTRPPPPPAAFATGSRGVREDDDDFRLPGAGYVLISGCRADELSNEAEFGGRQHGALTHFLDRALRAAAGTRVTYRDIMERVRAEVSAVFRSQHPQVEGTGIDSVVFGVERVTPRPYVLVEPAAPGFVEVQAGDIFGLQVDATLEVYPPGTKDFDAAHATGRVRITQVEALSSRGAVERGTVEPRSRAVLEAVRPPDFHAGVFFEGERLSPTLAAVASALGDHESVEIVDSRAAAHIRIRETASSIHLEGRDLERLATLANGTPSTVSGTVEAIAHWARWFAILALDNPSPAFAVDLSISSHQSLDEIPPPDIVAASPTDPAELSPETVPHGSWVAITATNTSAQDLYLVVLDLTSQGGVQPLYPAAGITDPLPSGRSLVLKIPAWVPAGRDHVVDWVKVIAASAPIPVEVFKLRPATRGTRAPSPQNESSLNRFLRSWAQGGTRDLGGGIGLAPVTSSGWAVAQTVLRVERTFAPSAASNSQSAEDANR